MNNNIHTPMSANMGGEPMLSNNSPSSNMALPSTGNFIDLHELAKGWKAAITRARDPATR
jgi:hypothetical protein